MYEITYKLIIESHKRTQNKKANLRLEKDFPTIEDIPQKDIQSGFQVKHPIKLEKIEDKSARVKDYTFHIPFLFKNMYPDISYEDFL